MTEKEYREIDGIRRSDLWKIHESPQKFHWAQMNPEPPTQALTFGAMVHKLLLEPDGFDAEFAVLPECDRRTKDGKAIYEAFMQSLEGKDVDIVSADDYELALDMVQAAKEAPFVERLLDGVHEQAFVWVDDLTGETCKSRLDCLSEINGKPMIVEYKTTTDASTDEFMRNAIRMGYDFQAAMQIEAVKHGSNICRNEDGSLQDPVFVFIAQEKKAPFAVNVMSADKAFIEHGQQVYRELLGIYHDCKVNDNWYGYQGKFEAINNLALPAWLAKELEN